MKRGPKPLSAEQLRLRGSKLAKRRLAEEANASKSRNSRAAGDAENLPEYLTPGSEAAELWLNVGQALIDDDKMDPERDAPAFGMMCRAYSDFIEATKVVDAEGRTCKSESGALYQNPAVGQMNKARDAYLAIAKRFGLTPHDRESE